MILKSYSPHCDPKKIVGSHVTRVPAISLTEFYCRFHPYKYYGKYVEDPFATNIKNERITYRQHSEPTRTNN